MISPMPVSIPVISETTLTAAASSVEINVPAGYEILFLEHHSVYGDNIAVQWLDMTFNGDTAANYDYSRQSFNSAGSTSNAQSLIQIGACGDTDGNEPHDNGIHVIFNRASQEKVVMGTRHYFMGKTGGIGDDCYGVHNEAKWRNTSDPITLITITASVGNFTANSKFILRGLRTDSAPALGGRDIVQLIGSTELTGSQENITFSGIPPGYGILWLFWHFMYGDNILQKNMGVIFNSDSGNNYDFSLQRHGSATSTTNGATQILLGVFSDTDGAAINANGFAVIFNQNGQEKVVVGTNTDVDKGGGNAEDLDGYHIEGKWRTATEINSVTVLSGNINFVSGAKVWLLGAKL